MRGESTAEDLHSAAKEAHKLAVSMLDFLSVGNPTMKPSVMVLVANSVIMNMVYNLYPDIMKEMAEGGGPHEQSTTNFLTALQCVAETMLTDFLTGRKEYNLPKEEGTISHADAYAELTKHIDAMVDIIGNLATS